MLVKLSLLIFLAVGLLPAAPQSFEVASVKRVPAGLRVASGSVGARGNTFEARAATLGWVIRWAYGLQQFELDGPAWLMWRPDNSMPRFDVLAKGAGDLRVMLQHLLVERFALAFHFEERALEVFVVHPGAGRLTLVESAQFGVFTLQGDVLSIRHSTMAELCDDLSLGLHVPILDESGLAGRRFDASVRILRDGAGLEEWTAAVVVGIKKDLGFPVSRARRVLRVMVVDSALEVPTEN